MRIELNTLANRIKDSRTKADLNSEPVNVQMPSTKKTVILVWKQWYHNAHHSQFRETSWGLGDILRGAYGMYVLANKMGFRLIVDFSLHPISEFLQMREHEFSALVQEKKDTVPYIDGIINYYAVTKFVEEQLATTDVLLMFTSFGLYTYENPVTSELREFMSTILTPTKEFQEYIDANISIIPHKPYSILHYRLNDDELVHNDGNRQNMNKLYANHVLANKRDTDILLSDSRSLKNASLGIFSFNEPICHIGVSADKSAIRQTLFELILLSKATSIKSYSWYHWVSGFVQIISKIYDIPLEGHCHFRG